MGLGLHGGGVGATKFFAKQGSRVLVTDKKNRKDLKKSLNKLKEFENIEYVLGKHRIRDFKNADLIIKNPGVPRNSEYLKIAEKSGASIETDIGLFFKLCPSKKIIGVTGTKGKSTIATLITKLLKTKYNTVLAGNIRVSALEILSKVDNNTVVVLEMSSWQLEDLGLYKKSPHIAVVTNIIPDHLNRHQGMEDYIQAKKNIFKFQTAKDFLILNKDDNIVRQFTNQSKARSILFSKKQAGEYVNNIQLIGEHNLYNISAAILVAKIFKIPDISIKKTLKRFKGLEGRMEFIGEIRGVKYYNDTTATIPEATIEALKSLSCLNTKSKQGQNIILIAGGADKNLNFEELIREVNKKTKFLILLPGTATTKIKKEVNKQQTIEVGNMEKAVEKASKHAKKGDIVLLSPGCASFGLFKHEFDRGKKFKLWVEKLKNQ